MNSKLWLAVINIEETNNFLVLNFNKIFNHGLFKRGRKHVLRC